MEVKYISPSPSISYSLTLYLSFHTFLSIFLCSPLVYTSNCKIKCLFACFCIFFCQKVYLIGYFFLRLCSMVWGDFHHCYTRRLSCQLTLLFASIFWWKNLYPSTDFFPLFLSVRLAHEDDDEVLPIFEYICFVIEGMQTEAHAHMFDGAVNASFCMFCWKW